MRKIVIISLAIIIILIGAYFIYQRYFRENNIFKTTPIAPTNNPTIPNKVQTEKPEIIPPIDKFNERLTLKWYGKDVTSADTAKEVCGKNFTGLHVGDDLEIFPDEVEKEVPVFAIADGTIRQVGHVNGYGGLLVIQNNLNGQAVMVYYGHISLGSVSLKEGDSVTAGQKLGLLGKACSAETDNERKHLHFAIHKGTEIDVRGYVQTQAELDVWIDPKTYF